MKAFVTFKYQEGREVCLTMFESEEDMLGRPTYQKEPLQINGEPLEVKEPPEPSIIIWENLEKTRKQILMRKAISYFVIFLMLCFVLYLFTFIRYYVVNTLNRFPKSI